MRFIVCNRFCQFLESKRCYLYHRLVYFFKASFVNRNHVAHQAAFSIVNYFCNSVSPSWALLQYSRVRTLAQSPNDHKPRTDPTATSDAIVLLPKAPQAQVWSCPNGTSTSPCSCRACIYREVEILAANTAHIFIFFFVNRAWHCWRATLILGQQFWSYGWILLSA